MRLVLLTLGFKCLIENIDFLSVRITAFLAEVLHIFSTWLDFRQMVLRIGIANAIEVIAVDNDSSFLHNAEGSLHSRLLHIPDHFVVNTLQIKDQHTFLNQFGLHLHL